MLVIRLRRIGKKNKPTYRVVVAEHSYPIDGKFTADLGFYNPHTKKVGLELKEVSLWLDKGAKPSNTVAKILQHEKLKHKSVVIHTRNRKPKAELKPAKESSKPAAAPTEEAQTPAANDTENSAETPSAEVEESVVEESTPEEEPVAQA
ncbi:MAG: 30S ribosomal protein S16 [Candidatus Berkelbacteria bacterium]|nr:MAG: 30S ribosomal protein S16 [Candidatus Berkelbacteria bacterium]QQG52007.1 MAG: 30S ribosomal protein S16 [Candidatus Berkelbacteria bacterium]